MKKLERWIKPHLRSFWESRTKYLPVYVEELLINGYNKKRFKAEIQLINVDHKNHNTQPSIIHYSFNRAATQYVKSILVDCARQVGLIPINLHGYAFNSDFPFLDQLSKEEMESYAYIFKDKGYLYSVFGGVIEGIPNLSKYKLILVTRDPRDILVSRYFSIVYSHQSPSRAGNKYNNFSLERIKAKNSTIDEYVLRESDRLLNTFTRYQSILTSKYDNVYVTKYEHMVSDFEEWLTKLLDYCELEISRNLFLRLIDNNNRKKPKKEDIHQHIRKGEPGDFVDKLLPETIQFLNKKFHSILNCYNYY